MARRGRPFKGEPFQRKDKEGNLSKSFYFYNPTLKQQVSLGVTTLEEARSKAREMFPALFSVEPTTPKYHGAHSVTSVASPPPKSGFVPPSIPDSSAFAESVAVSSMEGNAALDAWQTLPTPGQQALPNVRLVEPLPVIPPSNDGKAPEPPRSISSAPRKGKGFTEEEIAKMTGGIHKVVASLNVVVLEMGVRYAGRNPYELSEDELTLLGEGWKMYINQYFASTKPEPWMLILAGNVLAAAAMYANGEPIKKDGSK